MSCSCVQTQRIEIKQELSLEVRLLAKRPDDRRKRFDSDDEDEAWAFAGPEGAVMKWSKSFGQFVPLPWPCEFMVFFPGKRGHGNKRRAVFSDDKLEAKDTARRIRGSMFQRGPSNGIVELISAFQ